MSRKRSTRTTPPKPDLVLLLAELDHPNSARRRDAVEALGNLGDSRVLPALERIQANDHEMTVLGSISEAATQAIEQLQRQT